MDADAGPQATLTETEDGDVEVRRANRHAPVEAWSLVLAALGISHRVSGRPADARGGEDVFSLLVPAGHEAAARAALDANDREERDRAAAPPRPQPPDRGRSFAPLLVSAALGGFFLVTGPRTGVSRWFTAGSADADAIIRGQWYRAMTALTLHGDAMHLLGNVVAGLVFLTAVSRWLGGGLATALTLFAGFAGNLATAYYHGGAHVSVGASTATFGALGILGGLQFVFRARTRAPWEPRGPLGRAWPALAACLALFAMLGVGEGGVDIGAHVFGLGFGVVFGVMAGFLPVTPRWLDVLLGLFVFAVVASGWFAAGVF